MAREVTQEILRSMKLDDRPSLHELVLFEREKPTPKELLQVTAPVENGAVVLRVRVLPDYGNDGETYTYDRSADAAVAAAAIIENFADSVGMDTDDCRLALFGVTNGVRRDEMCTWHLTSFPSTGILDEPDLTRRHRQLVELEGAVKILFTK